jgi:hypothetical protein
MERWSSILMQNCRGISMRRFFRNNGLSIVMSFFFLSFLFGQYIAGHLQHNENQLEHGQPTVSFVAYFGTDHFLEATMENWESEFLQMFGFIVFTTFLYQKGSAESKDPEKEERVDRDPRKSCGLPNAKHLVRVRELL